MTDYVMICKDENNHSIYYRMEDDCIFRDTPTPAPSSSRALGYISGGVGVILYAVLGKLTIESHVSGAALCLGSFLVGMLVAIPCLSSVLHQAERLFTTDNRESLPMERILHMYESGLVFWKKYIRLLRFLFVLASLSSVFLLFGSKNLIILLSATGLWWGWAFMLGVSRPLSRSKFEKHIAPYLAISKRRVSGEVK